MPFRICKTIDIENGHMLSKHPDKCQFPHGHTRKVEFVLEANDLDQNQMVCDFKIIKDAIGDWLDSFDHALCMNTDDHTSLALLAYAQNQHAHYPLQPTPPPCLRLRLGNRHLMGRIPRLTPMATRKKPSSLPDIQKSRDSRSFQVDLLDAPNSGSSISTIATTDPIC